MSKLSNALFSFSARGSLGKALSFRRKGNQTIAEKMPIPEDAKSLAQLSWRHMYQKAVALWHLLSAEEKDDWESKARIRHMTGFAWFMSQCLKPNPGIYLPLQGGIMQGDIDMATHKITDLPQPALDQHAATKKYVDDLPVKVHGATKHTDITREIFLPWGEAYPAGGEPTTKGLLGGPNEDTPVAFFWMKVPIDFVSFTSVKAIWYAEGTGNMYWLLNASYGACGEDKTAHTDEPMLGVTASGGEDIRNCQEPANALTLGSLAIGDILKLIFYREGSHASDTIDEEDVLLEGLLFTYVANQ